MNVLNTTSLIDHCLTTQSGLNSIAYMEVLYEYISSDHKPVSVCIECGLLCVESTPTIHTNDISGKVDWSKV